MQGSPCAGREEICRTYPEAVACAGTGRAQSAFLLTRRGRFVEVETVNESLQALQVNRTVGLTCSEADASF